ncbi:MAG: TolC family protein [Bacteroidia bacterium]|nr:TolC family protein [Bacteroidia bacterium]
MRNMVVGAGWLWGLLLPLHAQEAAAPPAPLTSLEQAWELALANQVSLSLTRAQARDLAADASISQAGWWPAVRVTGQTDYYPSLPVQLIPGEIFGGQPGSFQQVRFGQPWVMSTGVEFQWAIVQAEKWLDTRAAQMSVAQGTLQTDLEADRLRVSLIQAYYEVVFWQDYVPFTEELAVQALALGTVSRQRFEQQQISRLDLVRAEALEEQVRMQMTEARARHARALLRLEEVIGWSEAQPLVVADSLARRNLLRPTMPVAADDPAVRLAQLQAETAAIRLQARTWRAAPSLNLSGRYQFQTQTDDLFDQTQYNSFNYGLVSLGLQWTLFQGGTQRHLVQKQSIQLDQARLRTDQAIRQVDDQTRQWLSHWEEAAAQTDPAEKRLRLAQESLNLALARLTEGYSALDEYFQVYQEYTQAVQACYQNRLNLHVYYELLQR